MQIICYQVFMGKKLVILYKFTFVTCLVILILSVMPTSELPKINIRFADKIVHILLYFMLGIAVFMDFFINERRISVRFKRIAGVMLFVVFFGGIIEIIQYFIPYRTASFYDFFANFIGGILAVIFVLINKSLLKI